MGVCEWGADVAVARILEYVRPEERSGMPLVFDEFHHGFGMHGGSLSAVSQYLTRTPSGHFLAQALIAGLLLLFALAPRPLPPRDPDAASRADRRSSTRTRSATRTPTSARRAPRRSASRRRAFGGELAGRWPSSSGADDAAFLDAVTVRDPSLAPSVDVLRRALAAPVSAQRDFVDVSEALRAIERQLSMPPQRAP